MAEKDQIFATKMKYNGLLNFKDFYNFCYNWLVEETGLDVCEEKYSEKIKGEAKDIDIDWAGVRKVTDYFKFEVKVRFKLIALKDVEITQDGKKIKMQSGDVEMKVKGILIRDYEGKFERTAWGKFIRGIYEKWVIKSRIDEFEEKLFGDCDEFLGEAKAFLDLSGKR